MATPHFGGLLVVFKSLTFLLVTAQVSAEFCVPNKCSNDETCYNRPGSVVSTYACVCTHLQVGYDCSQNVFTRVLNTCYGTQCQSGTYSSPNYPNAYTFRDIRVYLLFIPGATEITFVFSNPFEVEPRKDELYIGAGLTYDDGLDLNGTNVPSKQIYFYENSIVPQPLTLFNTDSAFITWKTDNNIELQGFEVTWTTVFDRGFFVSCPADTRRDVGLNQTSSQVFFTTPTAKNSSGVVPTIVFQSHAPGDFFTIGTTQVTYTFADSNGNQDSCSFNVIIVQVDRTPPVATCPADIQREVGLTQASTQVFFTAPSATDDSGLIKTIVFQSHAPGDFFTIGNTQVTYTFADANGNQESCSFNVIVVQVDRVLPVVSCPAYTRREVGLTQTSTQVFFTAPTATDDSGITKTIVFQSHAPGDFFTIGNTVVTYTFADANGNQESCSFIVIVVQVDRVLPVATCPADIQREVGLTQTSTQVFFTTPTATDNSGLIPTIVFQSHAPGDFFTLGTTQVTYTFADANGNQESCSFNVIVVQVDRMLPVVSCPADTRWEVGSSQTSRQVFFTEPTSTDNSGVAPTVVSQSHTPGEFFTLGTTQVTYTFTDGNGNRASCSFNVIVVQADPVPPLITGCPGDIKSSISLEATDIAVFWTPPVTSDNSGLLPDIISNFSPGDRFAPGVWNVIYTSTDGAGNTHQCQFSITITRKAVSIIAVGILLAFVALYGLIITLMYLHLRRSNIALKKSVGDREGQELDPYTSLDTTNMKQPSYEEIKATRDGERGHTNEINGIEYENQCIVELTARVNKSNLGVADENTEPEYDLTSE